MITRRLFTFGMLAAPAIIRTPGLLMPIRQLPADAIRVTLLQRGTFILSLPVPVEIDPKLFSILLRDGKPYAAVLNL